MLRALVLTLALFLAMALKKGSKSCRSRCPRDWTLCAVSCGVSTFLTSLGRSCFLSSWDLGVQRTQFLGVWRSKGSAPAHCTTEMNTSGSASLGRGMLTTGKEECPFSPRAHLQDPCRARHHFGLPFPLPVRRWGRERHPCYPLALARKISPPDNFELIGGDRHRGRCTLRLSSWPFYSLLV